MKLLECMRIRKKWYDCFFVFHSMQKVARNFSPDSREFRLFENLLVDFLENKNIFNKYVLMSGIEKDYYEKEFYPSAKKVMTIIRHSIDMDYKITYSHNIVYVTLM